MESGVHVPRSKGCVSALDGANAADDGTDAPNDVVSPDCEGAACPFAMPTRIKLLRKPSKLMRTISPLDLPSFGKDCSSKLLLDADS